MLPRPEKISGDYYAAVYQALIGNYTVLPTLKDVHLNILNDLLGIKPEVRSHLLQFARESFSPSDFAFIETHLNPEDTRSNLQAVDHFVSPPVLDENRVDRLMRKIRDSKLDELDLVRRVSVNVSVSEFSQADIEEAANRLAPHYVIIPRTPGDYNAPLEIRLSQAREAELLPIKTTEILNSLKQQGLEGMSEGQTRRFSADIASPELRESVRVAIEGLGFNAAVVTRGGYTSAYDFEITRPKTQRGLLHGLGEFGQNDFQEFEIDFREADKALALVASRGFSALIISFNTCSIRVWPNEAAQLRDERRRADEAVAKMEKFLNLTPSPTRRIIVDVDNDRVKDLVLKLIRDRGIQCTFHEFKLGERSGGKYGYILVN